MNLNPCSHGTYVFEFSRVNSMATSGNDDTIVFARSKWGISNAIVMCGPAVNVQIFYIKLVLALKNNAMKI